MEDSGDLWLQTINNYRDNSINERRELFTFSEEEKTRCNGLKLKLENLQSLWKVFLTMRVIGQWTRGQRSITADGLPRPRAFLQSGAEQIRWRRWTSTAASHFKTQQKSVCFSTSSLWNPTCFYSCQSHSSNGISHWNLSLQPGLWVPVASVRGGLHFPMKWSVFSALVFPACPVSLWLLLTQPFATRFSLSSLLSCSSAQL